MLSSLTDLDLANLVALGTLSDNSKWMLTLHSKEAVARALSIQPMVKGLRARMFSPTSDIVNIRVHWLPVYIPMFTLVVNLSRFGAVHSVTWDYSKKDGFHYMRSTVRNFVLELDTDIKLPSL